MTHCCGLRTLCVVCRLAQRWGRDTSRLSKADSCAPREAYSTQLLSTDPEVRGTARGLLEGAPPPRSETRSGQVPQGQLSAFCTQRTIPFHTPQGYPLARSSNSQCGLWAGHAWLAEPESSLVDGLSGKGGVQILAWEHVDYVESHFEMCRSTCSNAICNELRGAVSHDVARAHSL